MFRIHFTLFSICIFNASVFGQICNTNRYTDNIVTDLLELQDIKYATANPYGIIQSQDLYFDFYEPMGDTLALRPLIIFTHGGAFLVGDKRQPFVPDFCRHFAKKGYVTAAISYRLGFNSLDQGSAERAAYRAVQDIRAAIRYFAEMSAIFRIDTNNIFLAGTSAGCVASLHSAFMTESDRPASTYGTLLEPQDLGCANCSGNTRYGNREVKVRGIINCWGAILDTLYINDPIADDVAVISFHGTNDLIVPYTYGNPFQLPIFPKMFGSELIHRRMDNMGLHNKLVTFHGAGHEPELLDWTYADTIFELTTPFLFELLQPQTSVISGAVTVCVGQIHSYTVEQQQGSRYCWESVGGLIISQSHNTVIVERNTEGQHQLIVREINSLDAVGEPRTISVTVLPLPKADFDQYHDAGTISFINRSSDAQQYEWFFGDGGNSNAAFPVHEYTVAGNYDVMLIATNGACQDTLVKTITVELCPVADFTYSAGTGSVKFNNLSDILSQHFWFFGDGNVSTETHPTHEFEYPGVYSVTLITEANGCRDTVTKQVVVVSVSINELYIANEIRFYPNPAFDFIELEFKNLAEQFFVIEIFNSEGKIILQIEVTSTQYQRIDLQKLSPGVYFIQLKNNQTVLREKLVKM